MSKSERVPRFVVGQRVYVKPGVMDEDYPDLPIGGWSGTVVKLTKRNPPTYDVRWDQRTLDNIHPIYSNRCERDGYDAGMLTGNALRLRTRDWAPCGGFPPQILGLSVIPGKPRQRPVAVVGTGELAIQDAAGQSVPGVRRFWQYAPKAVSVRPGRVSLELWPAGERAKGWLGCWA